MLLLWENHTEEKKQSACPRCPFLCTPPPPPVGAAPNTVACPEPCVHPDLHCGPSEGVAVGRGRLRDLGLTTSRLARCLMALAPGCGS